MEEKHDSESSVKETGCCPKFDPKPWDEKTASMEEKLFLKDHVTSIFHIPLNFGKVMTRSMEKIKKANAIPKNALVLSDENSLWGADVYIAVSKEVADAEMAKLSGIFLTKVFEGPYKDMKKWIAEMNRHVESKEKKIKKMYFFYTTCPKCAKAYGKNYTVILAQI